MKVIINDNFRPAVNKKRNRLPKHQMEAALKRMKEIQNG
jgi:hypothetical protein